MLEGTAKQKIPGGKLLAVKVKFDSELRDIQILGDFFLFPEDSLPKIEAALIGTPVGLDSGEISKRIDAVVAKNGIQMVGITPDAIAQTIKMAIR